MENRIKVSKKEVKPIIEATFPEYTGKKFFVVFTEKVSFYDLNWSGGTKSDYVSCDFEGNTHNLPSLAPWNNPIEGKTVEIPEGILIVKHSYFCGQDSGITIYSNPKNAPKYLKG